MPEPEPNTIFLSAEGASLLVRRFEQTWKRLPTETELEGILQAWALEESYVREATALGLDQNDPIIRQRLSQKMRFLAESARTVQEIDIATLQAHLDANSEKFRRPASLAFQQIPLASEQDAQAVLAELEEGGSPADFAGSSLLPSVVNMAPAPVIDRNFGRGFSDRLAQLPIGKWHGPLQSGFGQHLVRVTAHSQGILPMLDEIRDRVEADWRAVRARQSQATFSEALLKQYSVRLPLAGEVLSR